ncbi:MAG TPA: NTP transferase domain-containing protein [Gemmatimonadales bacterium]|nr:NTP transferase domain-containing protein [Gemmatimonadales bacterium]
MTLTLVVLAAGLGSRFGGLKQLEAVGPGGATLMDYSIHDALRAGFARVVFVIRPEMQEAFDATIGARYVSRLPVSTVTQRLEDIPAGFVVPEDRARPWGTAQAVLAARSVVTGPFAVLNADDFYGREALEQVAGFLGAPAGGEVYAVMGYRLDQTASSAGGVNRAVLEVDRRGGLSHIVEVRNLALASPGRFRGEVDSEPRIVAADALVSMNLWGLTPAIFPRLERGFEAFLARRPGPRAEYYLPEAVQEMLAEGGVSVRVLATASRWCGLTHPGDRVLVEQFLRDLVTAGEYPAEL